MPIMSFDILSAEEFGKIQSELRQIGKPTGELDTMIAAVARARHDYSKDKFIGDLGLKPRASSTALY